MTARPAQAADAVLVFWRPGCPYCAILRQGLRRAGLAAQEINIWDDPEAAARVRAITGGNETVPTVIVHGRAMVNPSARQVIAAARAASGGPAPPDVNESGWLARLRAAVFDHGRPAS